jgi:hypothetical protein
MKTYRVTIRATVTKTVTVEAENEDDAYVAAHEDFSVLCDGEDERYEEETLSIEEDET